MKCTAKRTDGEPCKAWAVTGLKVCRVHGASSPRSKAKRARALAEEKAAKAMRLFAEPVDIDPARALVELVQWTAGEVAYWREQVRALAESVATSDGGEDAPSLVWGKTREKIGGEDYGSTYEAAPRVEYRMLTDAQDRLAKYAAAALKAGVEERRVKLAEDQGALVAQVIRSILDQLDLSPAQAAKVPEVVPTQLRLLTAS